MYAALNAAAETFGILSMAKDFKWRLLGEVHGDASAALGIIHRKGLGKTRHIQTGLLWIQQIAAEQRLKFEKVLGKENLADLSTKRLDEKTKYLHTKASGYQYIIGRATEAPILHMISQARYQEEVLNGGQPQWQWLKYFNGDAGKQVNRRDHQCGEINCVTRRGNATCSGPQVLWGYNWPVQGSNGWNAAQLSQPRGSTRTFSAICHAGSWRVTGTETRGDHAPEGATFAGRHDFVVPWKEHSIGP